MKKYLLICLLLLQHLSLSAAEVNLYSARKEHLIKPLLQGFTKQTGIAVNIVTGQADTMIKRLQAEGRNSPADILLTVDVARLLRAKELGLFQPIQSRILTDGIPSNYRDTDAEWFGLSLRSRIIVYSPDRVDASRLVSYEDLASPAWRNRLCVRSSANIYNQSLVASLIAHNGLEATEKWAKGLVDNFARSPKGGDRDQIKAVAAGVCDIALVNTYYLAGMLVSDQEGDVVKANKVKLFWPNQSGRGAHMNISGAGVLKHAPHKEAAIRLIEYLASTEAQEWYAKVNHEYPVRKGIAVGATLASWGDFKADDLDLSQLGERNREAVLLMDRAGWK